MYGETIEIQKTVFGILCMCWDKRRIKGGGNMIPKIPGYRTRNPKTKDQQLVIRPLHTGSVHYVSPSHKGHDWFFPKHPPFINSLTPNDPYRGRTAPLTSKRCILYIYSTNIGTEYFKHGKFSSFFPLQNAVCFIILTYLVPVLFTFYIQVVLKLKK